MGSCFYFLPISSNICGSGDQGDPGGPGSPGGPGGQSGQDH